MALFPVYDMGVEHSFASVGDSWAPGTVIFTSAKCRENAVFALG